MKRILLLFPIAALLNGCAALFVIGTAAGLIVYDQRSLSIIEKDARIFYAIHKAIIRDHAFSQSNINVNAFNQVVLLLGETPNASLRVKAEQIARKTPNVRRVYDEIAVGMPISFAQKAKDSWITGEVKSTMLARKGLASGSIHVVTENAAVYLMGTVTKEQSRLAVEVARNIRGVKKVIKVFQYR